MNTNTVKAALQDLIIRLQDAEKGMKEVANGSSDAVMKEWLLAFAKERHGFHKDLEIESKKLGGDPEVKTSFLGDLHRMFIDVKLSITNSKEAMIDEIERGATILINDYDKVLNECNPKSELRDLLTAQKWKIKKELEALLEIRALQPVK